jgi:hypothetical protein
MGVDVNGVVWMSGKVVSGRNVLVELHEVAPIAHIGM